MAKSVIRTTDINFAAYLRVRHRFKIIEMKKDQKGRVTWGFDSPNENAGAGLLDEFYAGSTVPAVEYAAELKSLKSAIYNI